MGKKSLSGISHTKGPWRIDTGGGLFIEGREGQYIGEIDSEGGREESFANASLIASAPDLLIALRDICIRYPEDSAAYKIADKAISKVGA